MLSALYRFGAALAVPCLIMTAEPVDAGASEFTFQTVVLSGQPAPGTSGEQFGTTFRNPRINDAGQVALFNDLAGQPSSSGRSIFSTRTGSLQLVARTGNPTPGDPTTTYTLLTSSTLNLGFDQDGFVYFRSVLSGPTLEDCNNNGFFENDTIYFTDRGGALSIFFREDDSAPVDQPDATFDQLNVPIEVGSHTAGVFAPLKGGQCPTFTDAPQTYVLEDFHSAAGIEAIVVEGDAGPLKGTEMSAAFSVRYSPISDDIFGFVTVLSGPGVDGTNNLAFVLSDNGSLRIKAREGDPVPGHPGAFIDDGLGSLNASRRGDVHGFISVLQDVNGNRISMDIGIDVFAKAMLVSTSQEELRTLLALGEEFPGIPGSVVGFLGGSFLGDTRWPVAVADEGEAIFHAQLLSSSFLPDPSGEEITSANNEIMAFADATGTVLAAARESDPAPGLPAGVVLATRAAPLNFTFGPPAMDRAGRAAFVAGVSGAGFDPAIHNGLFFFDHERGGLRKVVAAGDQLDVVGDGSDVRVVRAVSAFNSGEAAEQNFNGPAMNEKNQLIFALEFEDDTAGVFIAKYQPQTPGDLNGDGIVNVFDLIDLLDDWGPCPDAGPCPGDLSGDGVVDVFDLVELLSLWS